MKEYFILQYRMLNRRFKDTGFEPILAYIILTLGFFGLSIFLFKKTEFAEYFYSLSALTLIGKLSENRRNEFLKICFGDKLMKKIRILENLICSIPFLAFLLYKQLFISAGLVLTFTPFLALLNFRTKLNIIILTPFSKESFEFLIGFRNTFYLIFLAYVLTFIAICVKNFNLGLFSMLFLFATILSYYSKPENEYFVWVYNRNPRYFLLGKIKTAMLNSSLLVFPIVLVLSFFFYQNSWMLLLFFIVGLAFLITIIVTKYSAYPDEINIPQGILLAICLWFPLILIVLIPYLFRKSENQLNGLLK
ncbi:MAG: ABC transporter permease [Leadbetterella sp.]|nr:ABC transporter permease [Leadbetterella sp.]